MARIKALSICTIYTDDWIRDRRIGKMPKSVFQDPKDSPAHSTYPIVCITSGTVVETSCVAYL